MSRMTTPAALPRRPRGRGSFLGGCRERRERAAESVRARDLVMDDRAGGVLLEDPDRALETPARAIHVTDRAALVGSAGVRLDHRHHALPDLVARRIHPHRLA